MASVRLEALQKRFDDKVVVQDINLDIEDGEFVAFLGPSGCGKTTCLRMIAGLEAPTAGKIWLGQKDITHASPRERDIAMVFQNYALYPHMTVRENMAMGLRYRKVDKATILQRIGDAAQLLGLEDLLDRKPGALSGGQRQRVALGRAIVREPQALLMDEPLSNLDAALRNRMRVELKLLHQRAPKTTIYVTHDQIEAMTMADRIAVMGEGRLRQFDTPVRVFNEPSDIFVARFIGSPQINILRGTLENGNTLRLLSQSMPLSEAAASALQGRTEVDIGLRPQAFSLDPGTGGIALQGRVSIVEPIGTQTHVHLDFSGTDIVVVVEPSRTPLPGSEVAVWARPANFYFFDKDTGAALRHGA